MRSVNQLANPNSTLGSPLQVLKAALPLGETDCPETRAAVRVCALASLMAYSDDPASLCSDWNCEVVQISNDDADLVIFYDDDIALVACRGSEFHWKDWLRNLSAKPLVTRNGTLHSGFYDAAAKAVIGINKCLTCDEEDSILNESKHVVLTGHSQGASVATLFASSMTSYGEHSLITFGSPRTGDELFAALTDGKLPNGRHLRFMHSNDIVPRIPVFFRNTICPLLPSLTRRFKHCGTPILITESGEWLVNPTRWQAFWSRLKGFRFDLVRDHLMANYLGALSNASD